MDDPLGPFRAAPDRAGIFLDFDGTLSEIVFLPSDARPVEGAREILGRLAERFRLVTIVSGRSARELAEWLGPEIEIWGTHGAERTHRGIWEMSDEAASYADLMREVHAAAAAGMERLGLEGTVLEDKSVIIGLHFRAAADRERARRELDRLAADLAERYGLVRAGGRLAFELRPPMELTKRRVVLKRARETGLDAVAFAGDDSVDLPAFDALDELAAEGIATLRVAVDSNEAPPELIARADLVVAGPAGLLELFRRLLDADRNFSS